MPAGNCGNLVTRPPSAFTSATSAAFCSGVNRRRRSTTTYNLAVQSRASFWTLQKDKALLLTRSPGIV